MSFSFTFIRWFTNYGQIINCNLATISHHFTKRCHNYFILIYWKSVWWYFLQNPESHPIVVLLQSIKLFRFSKCKNNLGTLIQFPNHFPQYREIASTSDSLESASSKSSMQVFALKFSWLSTILNGYSLSTEYAGR